MLKARADVVRRFMKAFLEWVQGFSYLTPALLANFFFEGLDQSGETLLLGVGNAHPPLQGFRRLAKPVVGIDVLFASEAELGNVEKLYPGKEVVEA